MWTERNGSAWVIVGLALVAQGQNRHDVGVLVQGIQGEIAGSAKQSNAAILHHTLRHTPKAEIAGSTYTKETAMPKFVIERAIPGIGGSKAAELQAISQKSCGVLQELGPDIQWVQSYVTGDKIYCVYNAASEELVREHAKRGGFPANSVARVVTTIDPNTAEA